MTVYEIVKAKLSNTVDDVDILMGIDEVDQAIKNYCHITEVPEALRFTEANMAIDLINYQYETKTPTSEDTEDIDLGSLKSIKMGDTTLSFGADGSSSSRSKALNSHTPRLDVLILNYKDQLNNFRRLW